jgi:hypothetical protein
MAFDTLEQLLGFFPTTTYTLYITLGLIQLYDCIDRIEDETSSHYPSKQNSDSSCSWVPKLKGLFLLLSYVALSAQIRRKVMHAVSLATVESRMHTWQSLRRTLPVTSWRNYSFIAWSSEIAPKAISCSAIVFQFVHNICSWNREFFGHDWDIGSVHDVGFRAKGKLCGQKVFL